MKLVLNCQNIDVINAFINIGKEIDVVVFNAKLEKILFDFIIKGNVSVYVLDSSTSYSQKAVDFIKKRYPYIPVVIFGREDITLIKNADIYLPYDVNESGVGYDILLKSIKFNVDVYEKNNKKLQKLTSKIEDEIEFGKCKYDPTRRTFYYKDKEIKRLSSKEGGILEVLASNYGEIVKKEVILEKVWRKSDYFSGRSMDVYITHLRKLLRENKTGLTINNISGVGLILE